MPTKPRSSAKCVSVRALHIQQGKKDVYSFFIPGSEITKVADISRIGRDGSGALRGFQRKEIRNHVRSIAQYLDHGDVLFPNAITLAFSSEVRFTRSRGLSPRRLSLVTEPGTLMIPIREEGERVGLIVDGQQRSLALANCKNKDLPVPVVAFVTDDVELLKKQFILMNKQRALPARLINELIAETDSVLLPKDLTSRQIPSVLCNHLNRNAKSPFYGLIDQLSDGESKSTAVVKDSAIIRMIRNSMNNPLGALAPYKALGNGSSEIEPMYLALMMFWRAVKDTFPKAWGLAPTKSRLMHSAGIEAMGILMDKIYARHGGKMDERAIRSDLQKLAAHCCWTSGTWEESGLDWNEIQSTPKHIRVLADTLVKLYASRAAR